MAGSTLSKGVGGHPEPLVALHVGHPRVVAQRVRDRAPAGCGRGQHAHRREALRPRAQVAQQLRHARHVLVPADAYEQVHGAARARDPGQLANRADPREAPRRGQGRHAAARRGAGLEPRGLRTAWSLARLGDAYAGAAASGAAQSRIASTALRIDLIVVG